MTDDPRGPASADDAGPDRPAGWAGPVDDITPAEAQELRAFFGDLVADEPAPRVTPSTVLRAARSDSRSAGSTARRVRVGVLAAAVVAVIATGTALLVASDRDRTGAATGTSVAAGSTTAATTGVGGSPGAPSSAAATTAAGSSSGAGPVTESGSEASSNASSAASASVPGSETMASTDPGICRSSTAAVLARVRTAARGTPLENARISLCRDPATLAASAQQLVVNIRPARSAACVDQLPVCRRVPGSANTYASEAAGGFRVWVYGGGHEMVVLATTRPAGAELTTLVAAARPVLAALS